MQKVAGHCGKCGAPYFLDEDQAELGVPMMNPTCMCWNMTSPYIPWAPIIYPSEPWGPYRIICTPGFVEPEPDPGSTAYPPPGYPEPQTGDPLPGGWFPNTWSGDSFRISCM